MQHREQKIQNNHTWDLAACRSRFEPWLGGNNSCFPSGRCPRFHHGCGKHGGVDLMPQVSEERWCAALAALLWLLSSPNVPAGRGIVMALSWEEAGIETNSSSSGELLFEIKNRGEKAQPLLILFSFYINPKYWCVLYSNLVFHDALAPKPLDII